MTIDRSRLMVESRIEKLFKNGASQAVRLPAECHFNDNKFYVTKDDTRGDVVVLNRLNVKTWKKFSFVITFYSCTS